VWLTLSQHPCWRKNWSRSKYISCRTSRQSGVFLSRIFQTVHSNFVVLVCCFENLYQNKHRSVLRLLEKITDLPRYTFLARCANIFLGRLDTESTDDVVDACSQLLQKESPTEYLRQLSIARKSLLANKTNLPLLTNGKSNGELSGDNQLRSLGYPVLIHIDALLVSGVVDRAIDIAVKMEECLSLSERDQAEAWSKIFHYLAQTGQVFLDGFPLNRDDYLMNRKIIIEKIVSASCPLAVDVFIDGYVRILEQVAKLAGVSEEERLYVQRACHQTVLRVFQAKYSEQQGIEMFHRLYWKDLDGAVSGSTSRWSSLTLSSSKQELRKWAFELLTTENEIPHSLRLENTDRPDLDVLVRRASGRAMSTMQTMQIESEKSVERRLANVGTETHESSTAANRNQSPTAASTGDMDVETEAVDEEEFSDAQEKQSEDDGVDSTTREENESEAAEVDDEDDEDDESDEEDYNEAHVEDGAMDRIEANEVEEIVIADSSDDDDAEEANIAEIVNSEEDGNDSDETADEEGISELFDKGDEAKESDEEAVEADDDSEGEPDHDSHDEEGSEVEVVDVDMGEDHEEEEEEEEEEISNGKIVDEEAMEKESDARSHSSAEAGPIEGAANQSMDEAGSQTGYEPECVYTEQSEEEVSEAMHTEDEEEERESLVSLPRRNIEYSLCQTGLLKSFPVVSGNR